MLHRGLVRAGVDPDLALLDDRELVVVHDFDRIFDRHDMSAPRTVDVADHRRDRRRLPRTGGSRDQDQTARTVGERPHHDGEPELLERRDLGANTPDRESDQSSLAEHVDPEAADALQGVADIGLVRRLELAALVLAHDRQSERVGILRCQLAEGRRLEIPVHPEERNVAHLQVEVARATLHGVPKQLVDIHPGFRFGTIAP